MSVPTNFALVIGGMKCGTTSLFELLTQHPQIARCSEKEPEFFADEVRFSRGFDWYQSLWDRWSSTNSIALEASTVYTKFPLWAHVPDRIASISGARFRFIYMLRNPIAQIQSHMQHARFAGWESAQSVRTPDYMLDIVRYAMQMDEYLRVFSREDFLLLTLEEFNEAPEEALRKVCTFLQVDPEYAFQGVRTVFNGGQMYSAPKPVAHIANSESLRVLKRFVPSAAWHFVRSAVARVAGTSNEFDLGEAEMARILRELQSDRERLRAEHAIDVDRYWPIAHSAEA